MDATGSASGTSISFSSDGFFSPYTDGTLTNNFYSTPYANLFGGYLGSYNQNGIHITLSGLNVGQAYTLYTYSEQDGMSNAGRSMDVTANGVTKNDTQGGEGSFVAGSTYLQFNGVADAQGRVNIAVSTVLAESDLNGLQLVTTTPEPSGMALLGMGMLSLTGLLRKRFGR